MISHARISALTATAAAGFIAAAGNGQIDINPPVNYATGLRADGMAAGDWDGDGDTDLATTADNPDRIVLLANSGDGTFAIAGSVPVPNSSSPEELVAGDLDGDGDTDLAVLLRDLNQVRPVINAGGGAFALGTGAAIGLNGRGMTIGDLDLDNDLDIAVANRDSNSATALRNSGKGTFTSITLNTQLEPRAAAIGSLVGSDLPDIAVTNHDSDTVSVFNGATMMLATVINVGSSNSPEGIAAADIDSDGDDDLIVATGDDVGSNDVRVFRNNGGTFAFGGSFNTNGLDTSTVMAADLDCDGALDLVTGNETSNSLSFLRNGGTGSFALAGTSTVGIRPGQLISADLDGDGDADVAVANRDSNNVSVLINDTCTHVMPGDCNGDGVVNVNDLLTVVAAWGACTGCAADLNGDGQVNVNDLLMVVGNWS